MNNTINQIINYFKENEDVFNACIEELDGYDGYLCDDRYYSMDDLNEFYGDTAPIDLLYRAFYGYDAESWTTDANGNKNYGAFNPNREYFSYNGYGNLVSSDYKDYSGHLDHYCVERMSKYRSHISSIDDDEELSALFDALEEDEDDE